MSMQMADPHIGMVSFQNELAKGKIEIGPVRGYIDLYSHFDVPAPGEKRLTYVRLSKDLKTVKAFICCIQNGTVDGFPCISVGYAVPLEHRNQGLAKNILKDVMKDQSIQANKHGISTLYFESIIDIDNIPSQRVTEAIFNVECESITDRASGRPAYRYTKRFDING